MRELLEPVPAIVRRIEDERRQDVVDSMVETVTFWGRHYKVCMTHCVDNRGAPANRTQRGRVVSIGDRQETGQTRVCVALDDGREVVVAIEMHDASALQEGQAMEVHWQ